MRTLSPKVAMLVSLIGTAILQVPVVYAQTYTVNYTIAAWNASGSFTFQIGTAQNSATNQIEGYMRMVCPDGDIVEINPLVISSLEQRLESDSIQWSNYPQMNYSVPKYSRVTQIQSSTVTQIQSSIAAELSKLRDFKSLLEDQSRMQTLISQLQSSSAVSDLNWSYVLQTIRSLQVQVTGTLH